MNKFVIKKTQLRTRAAAPTTVAGPAKPAGASAPAADAKPPTALGRMPTMKSKPPTSIGRTPTVLGRAPTVLGRAPAMNSKPPTSIGRTPTVLGKPPAKAEPEKSADKKDLNAFVASVCTGLAMPVGVAVECAEKMQDQRDEETRLTAETMLRSVQAVQRVLDDVQTFVRLENGSLKLTLEPTDCLQLAREVREAYLPYVVERGVTITVDDGPLPLLSLDALRIRQMLAILVENSVKFTTSGRIGITFAYFGQKLSMTVEDTGCGMPEGASATAADPFSRLGDSECADGPGLGLAIVKGLAKLMGGDMEITSAPGIGTSVRVVLSGVASEDSTAAVSRRLQKIDIRAPRSRSMRIVIAEGSPVSLAFLVGMFRAMGFTNVIGTTKGMDALSVILTEGVDLVLVCLELKDMEVETLATEIHKLPGYGQLPIYGITSEEHDCSALLKAGLAEVVKKPITREKLHRIVG